MVRELTRSPGAERSAPHPRGDGPRVTERLTDHPACSPPAWGWSGVTKRELSGRDVLPTRVGMVRGGSESQGTGTGAPHPRGDGPRQSRGTCASCACSPPAWGWSGGDQPDQRDGGVLPTRVGMVRMGIRLIRGSWRAPHPRGDGPSCCPVASRLTRCSPPAWGWSGLGDAAWDAGLVLPTRVGMVRNPDQRPRLPPGAPHPRGDGPPEPHSYHPPTKCSPPAWGWSGVRQPAGEKPQVLPTRVGMVRSARWRPRGRFRRLDVAFKRIFSG